MATNVKSFRFEPCVLLMVVVDTSLSKCGSVRFCRLNGSAVGIV